MLRTYFDRVREQFRLFCQSQAVPRDPFKDGDSCFLFATPVYTDRHEDPLFIPLPVILGRLHDQAQHYSEKASVAEILGVKGFRLSLLEIKMTVSQTGRPLGLGDNQGIYRCQVDPIPAYHDFGLLPAYTWDFHRQADTACEFSLYQVECLIFWLARTPLTYRLFMNDIIDNIARVCEYCPDEKAVLKAECERLHLCLVNTPLYCYQ